MADAVKDETLATVRELFSRFKERTDQLAMTLSGGEQQMVSIGRGMMARPTLLLPDEPSPGQTPIHMQYFSATCGSLPARRHYAPGGAGREELAGAFGPGPRAGHSRVAMEGVASHLMNDPHVKPASLGF